VIRTSPRWIVPLIRSLATSSYMNSSISERGKFSPSPIRRSYTTMLSRSPSVRSHSSQMASTMRFFSRSLFCRCLGLSSCIRLLSSEHPPPPGALDVRPSPLRFLMRRHKLGNLGANFAYSAPDVGFEQPSPVVVLDTLDIVQCFFHGVADVVESRKQLLQILMLVHHISHAPNSHVYGTSPLSPLSLSATTRRSSSACTSAAPKSKHTLEAHRLVRCVWRTVSVFGGGSATHRCATPPGPDPARCGASPPGRSRPRRVRRGGHLVRPRSARAATCARSQNSPRTPRSCPRP
jgi:hypothetical protein